jgi:hypothetical protein
MISIKTANHLWSLSSMTTHFITAEIDLTENPRQLQQAIEKELQRRGEPLRWAIAKTDRDRQKVLVEAIVTNPITDTSV